jgi:group I intron endonuclease
MNSVEPIFLNKTLEPSEIRGFDSVNDFSGIYKITNIITDVIYVGRSETIIKRWKRHIKTLDEKIHENIKLQRSWDKYGESNFRFEVLKYILDTNLLVEAEQSFLSNLNKDNAFNLNFDARGGGSIYELELDVQERYFKNFRESISNEEYVKKNRLHLEKIKNDDNFKRNHLLGIQKRCSSEEFKKETSEKFKLLWRDEKFRNSVTNKIKNKTQSKEFRKMCSERQIGKGINLGLFRFKNLVSDETFQGTTYDFYKKYNFNPSRIFEITKGRRKSYKNWVCESLVDNS